MPYLQAVIKEGLRIFPPVTGIMNKDVPPMGDTYKDVFLPPGTKIGYSVFGLFRNVSIWGKDVDVFRPERWLVEVEGEEKVREQEAALDLVFGYGRWQCLGRNVALMELNKVFVEVSFLLLLSAWIGWGLMIFSQLLKRFELELVDPTNPWKSTCHGIFTQSEMWLRATRREMARG